MLFEAKLGHVMSGYVRLCQEMSGAAWLGDKSVY
jgi:hypothetical protein